jgi:hypothetical protein
MEFYSAVKKNEILSFEGKWMEQENIILSEVRLRNIESACFCSYVEDRANKNTSIIIYTYKYTWSMFPKVGLLAVTKEGGKEENDRNTEKHRICVGARHNETHLELWVGRKGGGREAKGIRLI